MFTLSWKLEIWKFLVAIWQTTSKNATKVRATRAARLYFLVYPIRSLFSGFVVARCSRPCFNSQLTDFYGQYIQDQFSQPLLQDWTWELSEMWRKMSAVLWASCFSLKVVFLVDIRGWILKQRELLNQLASRLERCSPLCFSLLINRFLLSIYSRSIFSTAIAVLNLKIVQNMKKDVFFSMSKLFLIKDVFSCSYRRINIETKGIG